MEARVMKTEYVLDVVEISEVVEIQLRFDGLRLRVGLRS